MQQNVYHTSSANGAMTHRKTAKNEKWW